MPPASGLTFLNPAPDSSIIVELYPFLDAVFIRAQSEVECQTTEDRRPHLSEMLVQPWLAVL